MQPHYLLNSSLTPDYIKSAYGFDPIYTAGLTGKGQHIAIATYDGFYTQDIPMYFAQVDINPAPKVDVVNSTVTPISMTIRPRERSLMPSFRERLLLGRRSIFLPPLTIVMLAKFSFSLRSWTITARRWSIIAGVIVSPTKRRNTRTICCKFSRELSHKV